MSRNPIILDEWIPVVTPLGTGYAFMIETENHDNWYTVFMQDRSIVTLRQEKILTQKSYTHGRDMSDAEMRSAIEHFRERLRHGDDPRGESKGEGEGGLKIVR